MSIEARPLRSTALAAQIAARIDSGDLAEGDRLPSERELSEQFEVSRQTVRRALAQLADQRRVDVQPGRGTFVTDRRISERPRTLMSFTEMGASRGLTAGARVLEHRVEPASVDDSEMFAVAPGAPVFRMERLRLLDGLPVSVDLSRIPLERAPDLMSVDFQGASLYVALEQAGHAPVRADFAVYAMGADPRRAHHLAVDVGFPLLMAQTKAYDAEGVLIEAGLMAYRGDRYRLRTELTRPQEPTGDR